MLNYRVVSSFLRLVSLLCAAWFVGHAAKAQPPIPKVDACKYCKSIGKNCYACAFSPYGDAQGCFANGRCPNYSCTLVGTCP